MFNFGINLLFELFIPFFVFHFGWQMTFPLHQLKPNSKNPITKTQTNFLVNTGFLVKLFQKKPKWWYHFFMKKSKNNNIILGFWIWFQLMQRQGHKFQKLFFIGKEMPIVDCLTLQRYKKPPCSIPGWGGNHPRVNFSFTFLDK